MGDKISLDVNERNVHGKKVVKLRREGLVPGVVYGQGFEPVPIQAIQQVIDKTYHQAGKHHPVHLTVDGKHRRIAMIKDVDTDPVKHSIRHISFHAVKQNEKIEAEVPVHLIGEGESAAEKAGLIVLQNIDKLEVKAFPMDLPDALEVSIVDLAEAGERVTVADIKLPENVELVDNNSGREEEGEEHSITELVVASVYEPSALQAANEAAGGDAEDESAVEAENGGESESDQAGEDQPGGKAQNEPKGE